VLLQALQEAGPKGMLSAGAAVVADVLPSNAASLLADLEQAGLIGGWPDPMGPQLKRRRWWALDYLPARQPPPSNEALTVRKPRRPGQSRSTQYRRKCAGLLPLQEQADGLAWRDFGPACGKGGDVRLGKLAGQDKPAPKPVKVQRCPGWTHDPRYQLPPGAAVQGAGFAAAGVGVDVTTGRPWGAR
jgi:hypothetical protein